jgi:sterol desaturase/sphingolipid hydroxylase (fatty acid hydroxylase superfamily)
MSDTLLALEGQIRLTAFLGILGAMALWELAAPRRRREIPRLVRWSNNFALVAIDTALVRLAFPILAVGAAVIAQSEGWGLLNLIGVPAMAAAILGFLVLDLAIYGQHVLFHAVPVLWRLHRMHHSDTEFDVSTGVRFHPFEILLSMAIKIGVVVALGVPPVAVLLFEVVLNATSLFNHANLRLPGAADRVLRWVLVTPDMHRVHHSVHPVETNSNYGFNLPWWDWLFGTYRAQPRDGHEGMSIGLTRFRSRRDVWIDRMLIQPAVGPAHDPPNPTQKEPSGAP